MISFRCDQNDRSQLRDKQPSSNINSEHYSDHCIVFDNWFQLIIVNYIMNLRLFTALNVRLAPVTAHHRLAQNKFRCKSPHTTSRCEREREREKHRSNYWNALKMHLNILFSSPPDPPHRSTHISCNLQYKSILIGKIIPLVRERAHTFAFVRCLDWHSSGERPLDNNHHRLVVTRFALQSKPIMHTKCMVIDGMLLARWKVEGS